MTLGNARIGVKCFELQYCPKVFTLLPRFCHGRFADGFCILTSARTRSAGIFARFFARYAVANNTAVIDKTWLG